MATTVVNPAPNNGSSGNNGAGFLLGVIILVIFAVLFFVYAIPYIQQGLGGGTQVNIPDTIDVNVNQGK